MAEQSPAPGMSANRFKLLLIPILCVIMGYVLFAPEEVAPVPTLLVRPPAGTVDPTGAVPASGEVSVAPVSWPSIPLKDVLATNPFQRPDTLKAVKLPDPVTNVEPMIKPEPTEPPVPTVTPEEIAAKEHALQEELRVATKKLRLSALVRTSRGIGAMVGDQVVMVGDKLDERFRVAAIRSDGIVLELVDPPVEAIPATRPE